MAEYNPAVEQGLAVTESFLVSPEFKKLVEIMKREAEKYGSRILNPGLTDAEKGEFTELCRERFGCVPPQGYLAFLKVMNGYESNAYVIYDYAHPDARKTHFFEENACYIDKLRLTRKIIERKYLFIGRKNESYYGYNRKTGAYAHINDIFYNELETYASFAELLISIMQTAIDDEEPLTWYDSRKIAVLIDAKFPKTDVLSLSDAKLLEMIKEIVELDDLPEIDLKKSEDYLFAIKCALTRVAEINCNRENGRRQKIKSGYISILDENYNASEDDAWV